MQHSELIIQIKEATRVAIGQDYFNQIGLIIQSVTKSDYTFLSKLDELKIAEPLVSIKNGEFIENIEYSLNQTPCYEVATTCVAFFPVKVQELFPDDQYLKKTNVSSYIGSAIVGSNSSSPFAIITCLYENEPENPEEIITTLKFISKIIQERFERECLLLENYELKKVHKINIKEISHRETLLREIHHRVKNNLQIVASLLNLQKSKSEDPNVLDMISISQNRIYSIALVHELLYNSDDFESVDIKDYSERIINSIICRTALNNLELIIDVKNELIDLDTLIPCGLILCEAVTNFLKHAIHNNPSLEVRFVRNINERVLVIKDNGPGFPADVLAGQFDSLGIELIQSLSTQIDGTARLYNDNGAVVEVTFPV